MVLQAVATGSEGRTAVQYTTEEQTQTLNAMLATGHKVRIYLDPREAYVPGQFAREAMIPLDIGLNLPIPIPDLVVNEFGVSATLSFDRQPHVCLVPWRAMYALTCDATDTRVVFRPPPNVRTQTQPRREDSQGHALAEVIDLAAYRARREASRAG
jgi:hypothetical protein